MANDSCYASRTNSGRKQLSELFRTMVPKPIALAMPFNTIMAHLLK